MPVRRRGLAYARKAAGYSQESLAEAMGVDRTTVIRWEAGDCQPQPLHWPRLAGVLGITSDELRGLLGEPVARHGLPAAPAAVELMRHDGPVIDRRAVLIGTAAVAVLLGDAETLRRDLADAVDHAAMSDASLDDWEHTVFQHQLAHHYRPAASLLADLTTDFAELQRLLRRRAAILVPTRLTRVVAKMAGLMSATLLRLDQQASARNWARTAKAVANEAGDNQLRASMLTQEAYAYYYEGKLVEAGFVAAKAQHLAKQALCPAVASMAGLEARVHAAHSRAKEAYVALDRAERVLGRLSEEDQLPAPFCYNEAKFAQHTGSAYTRLGRTADAIRAQDRALALFARGDAFNRALIQLDRADCHVTDDDIPAAVTTVIQVIHTLAPDRRDPVIDNRARDILTRIPATASTLPEVSDLREVLQGQSEANPL